MVSCVSCRISHVAKGISFHRLPSNPDLRKAWLEFLNIIQENLPRTAYLCSQHFEEDAFDRSFQKSTLKKDSVPTITISRKKNISGKEKLRKRAKSQKVESFGKKIENVLPKTELELFDVTPNELIKIETKE